MMARPAGQQLPGDMESESRLLAWCLAAFFLFGATAGSVNLFVHTVVPVGRDKAVYAITLAVLLVAGLLLVRRPLLAGRFPLRWILLCDLTYVGAAYSVVDVERYANPILLMFAVLLAAWCLDLRGLALQLGIVLVLLWVALDPTYPRVDEHVTQVALRGLSLAGGAVLVYLLRRRSEVLLAETRVMSTTDTLTGLPNRRHLEDQMPGLCARAHREGLLLAALVLDLDRFKQINDEHGHATGDLVLKAVADSVRACLRGQDVVARTGGEEIVVLTLVDHADDALALAERLRLQVSRTSAAAPRGGDRVSTTASLGVATTTVDEVDGAVDRTWRLIEVSDEAMYAAKRQGRDRCVVAAGGTDADPARR